MKCVVTGGAGFIGSALVDALVASGHEVHVIDNLSSGHRSFLSEATTTLHEIDLTNDDANLEPVFAGADCVYHLAANADVRFGWNDTRRDLRQNVVATLRVAEAADAAGVPDVVFSSTGSVYGEALQIPTPEDATFPTQTSLYGASKVAAEGFIAAFATRGAFRATVLRFVSVLGPRYTHGHVIDFARQLHDHPEYLDVLGDGSQRKSYMHITDCVAGLMNLRAEDGFDVFNLGADSYCSVRDSIGWISEALGLAPDVRYGDGDRGWVGDNPFILLDVDKAHGAGWATQYGIRESVQATVDWISNNPWVLGAKDERMPT